MRAGVALLALLSTALVPLRAQEELIPRLAAPEVRGLVLPLHMDDPDFDYGPLLAELPGVGATHLLLQVKLFQEDTRSPRPGRNPLFSPSDATLLRTLRQARALGLVTAVVPLVILTAPQGDEWRGALAPPDWSEWFAGYREELLRYARVAEAGGASLLAVGSELCSSERLAGEWRELIRAVRAVFSGELTYSANWDHYRPVSFWYLLDLIGLSGYFELSRGEDPGEEELLAAWQRVRGTLERWRAQQGYRQPLVFLEVGYPSQVSAARAPWDYTRLDTIDLDLQRRCYGAFARAWSGAPDWAGVFFYEWWGEGGPADRGYTPRGKPALAELRRLFGRP